MSKIVGFHTPALDVRGTCVALYDYAKYNEDLLGNRSIIISPVSGKKTSDDLSVVKFSTRFKIIYYTDKSDLIKKLKDNQITHLYSIKYGKKDEIDKLGVKLLIHCVFDMSEPHGDIYCAVSETINKKFGGNWPVIPHMISHPKGNGQNLRKILKIPEESIVFGQHGGIDTFNNLGFVYQALLDIVNENKNIYFLFVNTPAFAMHSQIIFLPAISDIDEKNRFICTCDAMLMCSALGHSFGLSIGEFSVNNKRIIAFTNNDGKIITGAKFYNSAFQDILKDKAIYFTNEREMREAILNFKKPNNDEDLNCYSDYSPDKVMKKFKEVFLDN